MRLLSVSEAQFEHANPNEFEHPKRLAGRDRRRQILGIAEAQFAQTGFHGTTTHELARAARVSEPVLYAHFSSKERLFRQAVASNIETRLRTLHDRLTLIDSPKPAEFIESMAEATVAVCVSRQASAVLTTWALLEMPEYTGDLYRNEVGSVLLMWERALAERFPSSRTQERLSTHFVPHAVNACVAYGFWLAALRHTPESAGALARQFAAGVAQAASALVWVTPDIPLAAVESITPPHGLRGQADSGAR